MKVCSRIAAALAAVLLGASGAAQAQPFPARPVTMVVSFAPGGAVDAVARKVGLALADTLGQSVVIENRPGASGNIGSEYVTKSQPNGYTLLFAPSTLLANPLVMKSRPPFDLHRDLVPISLVASGPMLFIVPQNGPATLAEFLRQAKANPGKTNFATGGYGSAPHLAIEQFKLRAGVEGETILYKGTAPALTDLIGGQLSAMMEPSLSAMPQVRGGKVKAIAISAARRDPLFPDVPTFDEQGIADMQFSTWYGVWAPAGLPDALRQRLADALRTVLNSAEMKDWMRQQGYESMPVAGAAFSAFLHNEEKRYERIVRDAKVQPQ